jgi:hypothetical protein
LFFPVVLGLFTGVLDEALPNVLKSHDFLPSEIENNKYAMNN